MNKSEFVPFRDRKEAGERLAKELVGRKLQDPIVLAIPRGGVVVSRKLRVPYQTELAFGALGEDGTLVLDHHLIEKVGLSSTQIQQEQDYQREQIRQRLARFRGDKPAVELANRSVIVTDDGIATGSTMLAALKTLRTKEPLELIVAVPVAPKHQLELIARHCDRIVCLYSPEDFMAVGQFYESFEPVEDQQVEQLMRA
jgi:predicted phosphoribosyltransferase